MSEESTANITDNPEERTARENLEAGKSHARQAAEELRTAASQKAHEFGEVALEQGSRLTAAAGEKARQFRDQAADRASHLREFAGEHWDNAKDQLAGIKSETERYVRENPAKSVLMALGVGFILGRILR